MHGDRARCQIRADIGVRGDRVVVLGDLSGRTAARTIDGTFPRVLSRYVRDERVLDLPEAIRKMTSLPAAQLGIVDRGVVREGACADLVVFDAGRVADRATFDDPHRFPVGIETVIVNGVLTVFEEEHTGARAGRVLRARA
jgi:N-acyl-D-aspartate/D-glutamate deacylase